MIELKLPNNAAVAILRKRMSEEFQHRQKLGTVPEGFDLDDLPSDDLLSIAETSAVDLIFLLPFEIHLMDNNLPSIITEAIRSLSKVYNKLEFNMYDTERATRLLSPARRLKRYAGEGSGFILN